MDSRQEGVQSEHLKPFNQDSTKEEEEYCCAYQRYLLKLIKFPLTQEEQIVDFYYFWWDRSKTIKVHYAEFSPQIRRKLKHKIFICQQYSKRYLGFELSFFYEYLLKSFDLIAKVELVYEEEKDFDTLLEDIYKTHDPSFKEPVFNVTKQKKTPSTTTKGFFASIFDKIYQRFIRKSKPKESKSSQYHFFRDSYQ